MVSAAPQTTSLSQAAGKSPGKLFSLGPNALAVPRNLPPNMAEDDPEVGKTRLQWLLPFALARCGQDYEVWDEASQQMVVKNERLTLRPAMGELCQILACGPDLIYELVNRLVQTTNGPRSAKACDMLKKRSSGGAGVGRFAPDKEACITGVIWDVRVKRRKAPGTQAMQDILTALAQTDAFCGQELPSKSTIRSRWNTDEIKVALADPYARDHLHRLCGDPEMINGLNDLLCIDCTQMSSQSNGLLVVDSEGRELGPVNCIWALNSATRGVVGVLGFPGAQNSRLVSLTMRMALIDKRPLLDQYGLNDEIWPFHGRHAVVRHDQGSEFLNANVEALLTGSEVKVPLLDRSPSHTPHFRGGAERFNGTAQTLFAEFLKSPQAVAFKRPVKGKPAAIGIRLQDLNRALVTWVVKDWHKRPMEALGGDSPLSRCEKFVRGQCGLPASGIRPPLADDDELRWACLMREPRTVNQHGIKFLHRQYRDPCLNLLLRPGSRSSGNKIETRVDPYDLGRIFVKVPDKGGDERIVAVPWKSLSAHYRPTVLLEQRAQNPTLWEWRQIFRDIQRGNTGKPTPEAMEMLQHYRDSNCNTPTGGGRVGRRIRRNGEMRGFGGDACPKATKPQEVLPTSLMPPRPVESAGEGAEVTRLRVLDLSN